MPSNQRPPADTSSCTKLGCVLISTRRTHATAELWNIHWSVRKDLDFGFTLAGLRRGQRRRLCSRSDAIKKLRNSTVGYLNNFYIALAGVAQWIECQPANQRVTGSIPSQGSCLGCRPGPSRGKREASTYWCFSPSCFHSLTLALKINK